jgi:hypothetical protein
MTLDPVTLAVIQNGLRQVASEMDLVHEKTSFSPGISEGFDRSNGPLPFDAYMLLVESVGKRLLYSSDFLRIAPI